MRNFIQHTPCARTLQILPPPRRPPNAEPGRCSFPPIKRLSWLLKKIFQEPPQGKRRIPQRSISLPFSPFPLSVVLVCFFRVSCICCVDPCVIEWGGVLRLLGLTFWGVRTQPPFPHSKRSVFFDYTLFYPSIARLFQRSLLWRQSNFYPRCACIKPSFFFPLVVHRFLSHKFFEVKPLPSCSWVLNFFLFPGPILPNPGDQSVVIFLSRESPSG